ncbi:hypothetical protein PIB30_090745 [Stylosanthes scabra]|uniref:Uncharacterized protein n=1 Tax=Stylosanthes scabra TaxID=79078 RepID=A0ABU6ZT25_9FABA|nr:hypothetical protein [Stylosanthes scabra]
MQQAMEKQGRDIAEMRKQLTLWTRNTSAREAYTCWAHQQANPNLSEIHITQIPDLMQTNDEKGRPMFYGCLKSDYGASTSSQADPQDPITLWTAPPIPGKMKKGSLRKKKRRIWSIMDRDPTPRHGAQRLSIQSHTQDQAIHA